MAPGARLLDPAGCARPAASLLPTGRADSPVAHATRRAACVSCLILRVQRFVAGRGACGPGGHHAAPARAEQFRGAAQPASDLYGLGGTLLYLLSGAPAGRLRAPRSALEGLPAAPRRPCCTASGSPSAWTCLQINPKPILLRPARPDHSAAAAAGRPPSEFPQDRLRLDFRGSIQVRARGARLGLGLGLGCALLHRLPAGAVPGRRSSASSSLGSRRPPAHRRARRRAHRCSACAVRVRGSGAAWAGV